MGFSGNERWTPATVETVESDLAAQARAAELAAAAAALIINQPTETTEGDQ